MGVLRTVALALGVLIAISLAAKYVLLDSGALPATTDYEIDLDRVRQLAVSLRGRLPERVNVAFVGESHFPSFAVVAGTGFAPRPMALTAFQVAYASGRVVIDTTMPESLYRRGDREVSFDPEQYAAVQEALRTADGILLTHEHADHVGGLAASPHLDALIPKAFLTEEQVAGVERRAAAGFPPEALARVDPLRYDRYHAISAGIVVVKAPGHTPGSQLVYVRLRNGTELMFVGDVAWSHDNVEMETGRPRLVSRFFLGEDRSAVLDQLRALHTLERDEGIRLVVSHDGAHLRSLVDAGVLYEGLP